MTCLNLVRNIGIVNIFAVLLIVTLGYPAYGELTATVDNLSYSPRDIIIIQGDVDQRIEGYDYVLITVFDSEGTVVLDTDVELTQNNVFHYRLNLVTNNWDVYGPYEIQVQYVHEVRNLMFYYLSSVESPLTHIESRIQLDKEVYDWIDEIQITVIAPFFNIDEDRIETLGSKNKNNIEIPEYYKHNGLEIPEYYKHQSFKIVSGSGNHLDDYHLIETGKNSGIFHGVVHLTGKCGVDIDGDKRGCDVNPYNGIKQNLGSHVPYQGPFNGYLSVTDGNTVEFEFKNIDVTISQSAKISWNEAKIATDQFLLFDTKSEFFVDDPDMNIDPERLDKISVLWGKKSELAYSNAGHDATWNVYAQELELIETDLNTGIFRSFITVVADEKDDTSIHKIKASIDDEIFIKYTDRTLPADLNLRTLDVYEFIPICHLDVLCDRDMGSPLPSSELDVFIPFWIKDNAKWWAEGSIDDQSFVGGIQFMIKKGILKIPSTPEGSNENFQEIPHWIKNNAGWWANGQIDDDSFLQGIQFLIKEGMMTINN